ncbi:Rx, N-terminal [Dillenia turbinata]|uniref:Rx, N-terminal n=1 Tax=Dillenia turbinata TaxID=194707 RepID=A0AAN8V6X8_9MAGN
MGEALLAAYLQSLLDKLAPGPLMNFAIQEGFDSELRKWRSVLRKIKLVLGDAEEKQMNDIEVKRWLDDLLLLAYDADDALDDFDYEARQQQNNSLSDPANSSSQLRDMLPLIKKITTEFQDIEEQKSDLGLEDKREARSSIIHRRSETTSLVDSSEVVGREQDVIAILKFFNVKDISNGLHCPTSLTELYIARCQNLRSLPDGIISSNSKLQVLDIFGCESLESFPSGVLPSTLKTLKIWNCRKLESISEMLLCPTSLDRIEFWDYPNLKSFPECLCTDLTVLVIDGCESIESFPETGLPSPILRCLIIESSVEEKLEEMVEELNSLHFMPLHQNIGKRYMF